MNCLALRLRTILNFRHLSAYLAEYLATPALTVPQALASTRHTRSTIATRAQAQLAGLSLAKAVQHGLRLFLITSLRVVC